MSQFYKVSKKQFELDCLKLHWVMTGENSFETAEIKLPARATFASAGYDIYAPINFVLHPGAVITIPTGLKVELDPFKFLMIVPRSSLGFKYQLGLVNTVGIVDRDYYNNPDNEGHIMVRLINRGDKDCRIFAGTAFCQGIIMPYYTCRDDEVYTNRIGGFGSTDKEEAV